MKVLIIGGNRFVGLRLSMELDRAHDVDLNLLNRTGQAPHLKNAAIYKGDRRNLGLSGIDTDFDLVVDFAAYDEADARSALSHFKRIGRYIFISTASVYDEGADLAEDAFSPKLWDLNVTTGAVSADKAYQAGKRRAEAVFAQQADFDWVAVRFPFILGPDDYTRRLEFHVERIENNQTLHIPNLDARISMIHAEDACRFLTWSLQQKFTGPLNVASPAPLRMGDLLREIEKHLGQKALLVQQPSPQNISPYASRSDHFLNCENMTKLGFAARPIEKWLGDLIDGARQQAPPRGLLH